MLHQSVEIASNITNDDIRTVMTAPIDVYLRTQEALKFFC